MTIIDRRDSGKNKSVGNRQKFIKRYKNKIKSNIDKIADSKGITDVLGDRKIVIPEEDLQEPTFSHDMSTGERDIVMPGNRTLSQGDRIYRPPQDEDGSGASDGDDTLDEFSFTLTAEEFLDLYFSDMELPDFIKESLKGSSKHKFKRTGYSKDGIPARLDLVKTLKQAMARRMATRIKCSCNELAKRGRDFSDRFGLDNNIYDQSKCLGCNGTGFKKARYLDDVDMRYKHFTKQPYPVKQATMICLMDTSGSMGEFEKGLAKKFFLLLYLFLHKVYSNVEVRFVSHTTQAQEVDEQEFFYGRQSGGTMVSSGLEKVAEIISNINLEQTNVYIAQASDGDNWEDDDSVSCALVENLLKSVQYFAYIQTEEEDRLKRKQKHGVSDLMTVYSGINNKKLQARHVTNEAEVYPVLRSLFEVK